MTRYFHRTPIFLFAVYGLLCVALGVGCNKRGPNVGGATGSKPDAARKQAETLAALAVVGVAEARVKEDPALAKLGAEAKLFGKIPLPRPAVTVSMTFPTQKQPTTTPPTMTAVPPTAPVPPTPPTPPAPPVVRTQRPTSPPMIKDHVVSSIPYPTEGEADDDAVIQATHRVEELLLQLDPPVKYHPTAAELRNEFLRKESRTVRKPGDIEREELTKNGYSADRVYVEYDIEVTADQVRELRSQSRVRDAFRIAAGIAVIALAGFLFLRADEWTKGYLTSWLVVVAIVVVGGVGTALALI